VSISADIKYKPPADDKDLLVKAEPQQLYSAEAPMPLSMPVNVV